MNNDLKIFGGIILGTILLIIGAVFFLGGQNSTKSPVEATLSPIPTKEMILKDSWTVGTASAKVSVVEFGDFQCPSCKSEEAVLKDLKKHYGDKILFVYRHFPLVQIHQYALDSADAAEAAGLQGKFWEYHEKLYEISPELSNDNLLKAATALKLDLDQFKKDMASDAVRQKVLNDMAAGNKFGITGTPTFFVNGKMLKTQTLPSLADFKAEIDPLLKAK